MNDLFSSVRINILSPSEVTMNFWKSKSNYPTLSNKVVPHRSIEWKKSKSSVHREIELDKISIAYLGGPAFHKGWFVFKELMRSLAGTNNYKFYHFGKNSDESDDLHVVQVHVTSANYDAMIGEIKSRKIDFVVHWANWPETFSFTAFEALAGGADVLTNSMSGNVAELVRRTRRGKIFETQAELFDYMKSADALNTARKIQARRESDDATLSMSHMSLSVINKPDRVK
jgi:hypothetical protein